MPPSPDQAREMNSALIVDDHPLFCEALTMTLRVTLALKDIRVASTLAEATKALANAEPDIILLDLHLPDVGGLDGLIRIRKAAPDIPILVVSSLADNRIVRLAISAGANGFVPKHSEPEVFRRALDAIAAGDVYDEAAGGGEEEPPLDAIERLSELTPQQARILKLVCEGKLNKQIAYDLSIAETTVKTHMTAILRKLGARSRTQAVLIAQNANFSQLLNENGESG